MTTPRDPSLLSRPSTRDNPLDVEVVTTSEGALAILDRACGEVMHPVTGPLIEARAIYIERSRLLERLALPDPRPLVLLDVGLGGGTNALLAWQASEARSPGGRRLEIISFDRSWAAFDLARAPEYAAAFGFERNDVAERLRSSDFVEGHSTSWRMVLGELPDTLSAVPAASAELAFWDMFSPRANPDLWNVATFEALRAVCRSDVTVLTYSSATQIRSALLLAGFFVGTDLAVETGRPTTLATLELTRLDTPLDARFLSRLERSTLPFPNDAPSDALDQLRRHPQFARTTSA